MSLGSSGPSSPTELTTQFSQLRLTLEAPVRARLGRPVPLVFSVTNTAREAVTLALQGREPTADFLVFDTRGQQVWSLLRGQLLLGSLRLYPLGPGKRLTFRERWNQHSNSGNAVPPGEYLIRGVLMTDAPGGLASAPFRLRIEG